MLLRKKQLKKGKRGLSNSFQEIDILCQLVGASELNLRSAKLDFCKLLTGTLQTSFAVVVQIYFSIRTASPRENLLKEWTHLDALVTQSDTKS